MAKKRPKVSTAGSGGISREEAMNIGKKVTVPTPGTKKVVIEKTTPEPIAKTKTSSKPITKIASDDDPMVIVRIRKSFKKRAKSRASELDMTLYEYLELLVDKDLE